MHKLISITELSNKLKLIDDKTKKPSNHILRYWEKEFSEIKPTFINKRRYYDIKQIEIAKLIKFLLKDQGLTISGVKKVLKSNINNLDDYDSFSLKTKYQKQNIKNKTNKILEKIRSLKNYGKKNSY